MFKHLTFRPCRGASCSHISYSCSLFHLGILISFFRSILSVLWPSPTPYRYASPFHPSTLFLSFASLRHLYYVWYTSSCLLPHTWFHLHLCHCSWIDFCFPPCISTLSVPFCLLHPLELDQEVKISSWEDNDTSFLAWVYTCHIYRFWTLLALSPHRHTISLLLCYTHN